MIRKADIGDSAAIADIYNWYIDNTCVTFEEVPVSAADMGQRMQQGEAHCPWFVLEEDGAVLGYAYATFWKARSAYKLSRETTIYLHRDAIGDGRGYRLYRHLIDDLRPSPIHVLVAGIALPNAASVALHEKLGFRKAGQFAEVGRKFDQYIDVGYWQMNL